MLSPPFPGQGTGQERFKGNGEERRERKKKRARRDATCPMHLVGRGASVSIYGFIREQ